MKENNKIQEVNNFGIIIKVEKGKLSERVGRKV